MRAPATAPAATSAAGPRPRPGRRPIPAEAFEHGDERRYRRGCRCRLCTTAITEATRKRRYLRDTGRGTLRDPARAAAHIDQLRATGMQDAAVRDACKICPDVMYRIARGQGRIHYTVEARILAVPVPGPTGGRNGAHIDATGTRRRLRALAADGWTASELARRLGKNKQYVVYLQLGHGGGKVRRWLADEVRDLHTQLRGLSPESGGIPPARAEAARADAALKGWLGLGYWDDDEIDNPAFVPAVEYPENRDQLAAHRRREIEHLAAFNVPEHEIADRLGMGAAYVHDLIRDMRKVSR